MTVINRTLRALVYGDVNLNLIDGSAVWLTSTVECLARTGVEVTVLLKSRIETDRLLLPLHELANVHIVEPMRATMSLERRTRWRSTSATCLRQLSPAEWPWVSLMRLKLSRST